MISNEPMSDEEARDPIQFLRFVLERWPDYSSPQLFKEGAQIIRHFLTPDFSDGDFRNGVDGLVRIISSVKLECATLIDFEDRKGFINRAAVVGQDGVWLLQSIKAQCPACFGIGENGPTGACLICGGSGWGVA